jgi:hypothetical protein
VRPTQVTTTAPPYDGIREGAAELALRRHGFTGERLQKLARRVANDWLRAKGATLGDRYEDLVSSLCIVGLNGALRYDPTMYQRSYGSNGGEPFASFVADLMERRIVDWYRAKAEGNGDRRYDNDGRVWLAGDDIDEFSGQTLEEIDPRIVEKWGRAARLVTKPMHKWERVNERRVCKWQRAADGVEMELEDWLVRTADIAAKHLERTAA